jgi:hypothetical protein
VGRRRRLKSSKAERVKLRRGIFPAKKRNKSKALISHVLKQNEDLAWVLETWKGWLAGMSWCQPEPTQPLPEANHHVMTAQKLTG